MTVRFFMKYLVSKLGLDDESELCYLRIPAIHCSSSIGWATSSVVKMITTLGAVQDIRHLQSLLRHLTSNLTFQEAYDMTVRILGITVCCPRKHEPPRCLNYLTSPHVVIWSAVAASCAFLGLFEAQELMAKDRFEDIVPFHAPFLEGQEEGPRSLSRRWRDGSLESDLPIMQLKELFNVNHFIVSKANPHIAPILRQGICNSLWRQLCCQAGSSSRDGGQTQMQPDSGARFSVRRCSKTVCTRMEGRCYCGYARYTFAVTTQSNSVDIQTAGVDHSRVTAPDSDLLELGNRVLTSASDSITVFEGDLLRPERIHNGIMINVVKREALNLAARSNEPEQHRYSSAESVADIIQIESCDASSASDNGEADEAKFSGAMRA